jgi:hypothetical protein
MLSKKLRKVGKECRRAGDPVLSTLSACIDHVVCYLDIAHEDDLAGKEFGRTLAQLDLSAVIKAYEALATAQPTTEEAAQGLVEPSAKNGKKKDKKKEEKKRKKAEAPPVVADPAAVPQDDKPVEPAAESSDGAKKAKKDKKKAGKKRK